jgi:hypothetical protein
MGSGIASTAGNHYCAYLPSNTLLYPNSMAAIPQQSRLSMAEVLQTNIQRMNEMAFAQHSRKADLLPQPFNMDAG